MPRYFFHVMDGRAIVDLDGTELAGLAAVRTEAIRAAGAILTSEETGLTNAGPWQMTVANEGGDTVFSLRFEASTYEK